jgi:hypothetical protein
MTVTATRLQGFDRPVSIVRFPAQGPPRKTTVRIVPMEGAEQAPPVAVTTVVDHTTLMAEAMADAPAEEETLSEP